MSRDNAMENFLFHLPQQCGFYVLTGEFSLATQAQAALVRFVEAQRRTGLPSAWGALFWVDSGNSFDAYHAARVARQYGAEPSAILSRIRLARPFTAFQLQQMLKQIPALMPPPLVVISDLMKLFYDSEIQEDDLKRAHRFFMVELERLKRRAMVVSLLLKRDRHDCGRSPGKVAPSFGALDHSSRGPEGPSRGRQSRLIYLRRILTLADRLATPAITQPSSQARLA